MEKIEKDPFSKYIGLSVIGHVTLVSLFTFKIMFFPSEDIVIQSAIRVDIVALPDKKVDSAPKVAEQQPPKAVNIEPKKEEPKKIEDKADTIKKAKESQNKALEKLKALSALDKFKSEVESKTEKETPPEKTEPYKGNVITKGSDLRGLSKLQYDEYFAKLESHVKGNWVLPQWLADANLKAQVKVKIDERGYVTSKEVMTSSGNNVFDNMALEALEKSSPCPIAPSNLKTLVANEGIIFNFP